MKTTINILERSACFFIALVTIGLFMCNDSSDEITGDSKLKVINDCTTTINIYFDGTRLGSISSKNERTWEVPSGKHTVKATCTIATDYEAPHYFTSGQTTTIMLEFSNKNESLKHSEYVFQIQKSSLIQN